MGKEKKFVISLGGSLIVPASGIDYAFLKKFRQLILKQVALGQSFYIIAGGGETCRSYIRSAEKVLSIPEEDRDWLGIHSTRLNAHLIRTIFYDTANPEIIKNPTIRLAKSKEKITIAGGWKPGWSTDYVATLIAQEYEVTRVINLSNIDYAYDKDPKKHADAKKIKEINWSDFRQIVGDTWTPGLNAPFDPIASRKAQQLGLEVVIMNGKKLEMLEKYLNTGEFRGTLIKG